MPFFRDAVTRIENDAITKWKQSGKKVVGYTCSYVPPEIFHAAGILPVRLRGIETEGMEIGDAYFGPFICSFPKCLLQLAGKGVFSFLDGVLIIPGCDAMRRLDENWRKAGEDHPGIVPAWFEYFDVPHKSEVHGMKWFVQEIRNLVARIEQQFGVSITGAALRESIREYNRGRRLLKAVETLRAEENVRVSGTDVFSATIAGTVLPREEYTRQLEKWLADLAGREPLGTGKKRLMVIGSISDEIDLFQLIENGTDAVVVAENLCFGVRYEEPEGELIVGDVHGVAPMIDHGDALEGHLGQSIGHVQIVQDAVHVLAFDQDEIAVILGAVWVARVRVELQDRYDEGLDGGVEGMAAELFNVGDAFECLHGSSPFDGHKKTDAKVGRGVMVD